VLVLLTHDVVPLLVGEDANMRWPVEHAICAAWEFRDHDVYWLEEPTIPEDFEGHRRVHVEGGLAVASGKNLHTIYEFQKLKLRT